MKKGQLNQAFIYIVSIIIVVFIAFIVGRFVFTFTGDVESRQDTKLHDLVQQDYQSVYKVYGSEKIYDYRTSVDVQNVCFVQEPSCIGDLNISSSQQSEVQILVENGDNFIIIDEVGVESSSNIGNFINKVSLCFCIQPKNQRFSLIYTNERNRVLIEEQP